MFNIDFDTLNLIIEIMSTPVIVALIAAGTAIFVALLNKFLPDNILANLGKPKPPGRSLKGSWKSSWGPLPECALKYSEDVEIIKQNGYEILAKATRTENNIRREWDIQGRYDGLFLQMYYYPVVSTTDALDYGCYFLKKKADGSFDGYSTGFGNNDDGVTEEGITTDFHHLKRIS